MFCSAEKLPKAYAMRNTLDRARGIAASQRWFQGAYLCTIGFRIKAKKSEKILEESFVSSLRGRVKNLVCSNFLTCFREAV
jgi:hypothetical protein